MRDYRFPDVGMSHQECIRNTDPIVKPLRPLRKHQTTTPCGGVASIGTPQLDLSLSLQKCQTFSNHRRARRRPMQRLVRGR